jgi:hypothetical protein
MCLLSQLEDARAALRFANIIERDYKGRVKVVAVPGHGGRRYEVILRWRPMGVTVECRQDQTLGYQPCPSQASNQKRLCYHALASVTLALREQGFAVAWAKDRVGLRRLRNVHAGNIFWVMPWQSNNQVWVLGWKKEVERNLTPESLRI